jgi:hypothetical protein
MESRTHATIKEIATAEKIDPSYIGRILRLTLLAPDIIEEILDGRQWLALTPSMTKSPPVEWGEQRLKLGGYPQCGTRGQRRPVVPAPAQPRFMPPGTR